MSVNYAKIRTTALTFEPVVATSVVPNSIFVDAQANNSINAKNISGVSSSITSDASPFKKQMQAALPIANGTPVSKRPDGKIVPLDNDSIGAQKPIGFTLQEAQNADDIVYVFLTGPNLPGVVANKGFAPGDEIFSDNIPGGMVNNIATLNTDTSAILRIGIADCAAGVASNQASDLILSMEIVSMPSGV